MPLKKSCDQKKATTNIANQIVKAIGTTQQALLLGESVGLAVGDLSVESGGAAVGESADVAGVGACVSHAKSRFWEPL